MTNFSMMKMHPSHPMISAAPQTAVLVNNSMILIYNLKTRNGIVMNMPTSPLEGVSLKNHL